MKNILTGNVIYQDEKAPGTCEYPDCYEKRKCFHYCSEHHQIVCIAGNSDLRRPTPLAPDRAKSARKLKPSASKRSKSGAAGKA